MVIVRNARRYTIETEGNGLFCIITRKIDGATLFLQDDDAGQLCDDLDATHDKWTCDDVCSEYDEFMEIAS